MRNITDNEVQTAVAQARSNILDIAYAFETAEFMDKLTDTHGVRKSSKSIVAEEIFFLMLRITKVSEGIERLVERTHITPETASKIIQAFGEMFKGTIPTETASPQVATPAPTPFPEARQTVPVSSSGLRELSDLEPKMVPKPPVTTEPGKWATQKEEPAPQVTLGTVPDASNELKERLELRPKIMKQVVAEQPVTEVDEDDGPKPLTRTQILQSLTSKRTMATDIASIHKSGDTNTHT